ncbi:MAG: hypothetical protein AAEJ04_02585 [Planctomycetota bacterium]
MMKIAEYSFSGSVKILLLFTWILFLNAPLLAQSTLSGNGSHVTLLPLRDAVPVDIDWFSAFLEINNQNSDTDGVFDIVIKFMSSENVDDLLWRGTVSVGAGEQVKQLIGIPVNWDWVSRWRDDLSIRFHVSRNGVPLRVQGRGLRGPGGELVGNGAATGPIYDEEWFSRHSFDNNQNPTDLVILDVGNANASGLDNSTKSYLAGTHVSQGNAQSRKTLRRIPTEFRCLPQSLPTSREGLLGVDIVFLSGLDPEDFSLGQRQALRGAVKAGLIVVLKPDGKGRGLRWLPGEPLEPVVELDADGKEVVRFQIGGKAPKRLTADCVSVAQGMGQWLVLEKANGPWELPTVNGLRHPWHLGSARARLESGFPFRDFLEELDSRARPADPMRLILFLGLLYVCVLWPSIGVYLKKRKKLPHMVWLQPMVGISCILLIFVISTIRLGVLPRIDTEVVVVRFPGEDHAVAYVIESSYSPLGGKTELSSTETLPPAPLQIGASTQNFTFQWSLDGSTQVSCDRKIRTISHVVRCDVIEVAPTVRKVFMNEGISGDGGREIFEKLLASESGTKASLVSIVGDPQHRHYSNRMDGTEIVCRGLERTTAGLFFDDFSMERLDVKPETSLTVMDAATTKHTEDPR